MKKNSKKEKLYYLCPFCLNTNIVERFGEGKDYLHCNNCNEDIGQQPLMEKKAIAILKEKYLTERANKEPETWQKRTTQEKITLIISIVAILAFVLLIILLVIFSGK